MHQQLLSRETQARIVFFNARCAVALPTDNSEAICLQETAMVPLFFPLYFRLTSM